MTHNEEGKKAINPNGPRINKEVTISTGPRNSDLTVFHIVTKLRYKKNQNETSRDENYNVKDEK